jgi:hypothetical protein
LAIGHYGEAFCPITELAGGALSGQGEHYSNTSDRLVILIFNPNDRFAGDTLANVIDGAFALHDYDIEFRG